MIRNYAYNAYYHICIMRLITFLHANQPNDVISYALSGSASSPGFAARKRCWSRSFRSLVSLPSRRARIRVAPTAYEIDPKNRTSGGNSFRYDAELLENSPMNFRNITHSVASSLEYKIKLKIYMPIFFRRILTRFLFTFIL